MQPPFLDCGVKESQLRHFVVSVSAAGVSTNSIRLIKKMWQRERRGIERTEEKTRNPR